MRHQRSTTRRTSAAPPAAVHVLFAAVLCLICLLGGACGLPYDSSPAALPGGLPGALTNPVATVPTTTLPKSGHAFPAYFYYIQSGTLLQFTQDILRPFTIHEVLNTLEGGPSLTDASPKGGGPVTTDLPVGSDLRAIGPQNGVVNDVAHVRLDAVFYELGTPQAILELGQIVYSLTASLRVRSVQFYSPDGSAAPAVIAGGQVVTGAVNEADYCSELKAGCPVPKGTTSTTAAR